MISKTLKSAEEMLQKANQTFAGKKEGEGKTEEGEGGEAGGDEKVCKFSFGYTHYDEHRKVNMGRYKILGHYSVSDCL